VEKDVMAYKDVINHIPTKAKTIPVPAKAGFHRKHSTRENIYPFIDANAIKTRLFKK
jgi:hypothetical protein